MLNEIISPQLHHIAIQVRDLKVSTQFYQKLFGLQMERHFYLDEEEIIWLMGNRWRLELIVGKQEKDLFHSSPSSHHIALEVTDITEWEKVCHQMQIKIVEGPLTLLDGGRIFFIKGPDGEQIEFIQPR